MSNTSFNDFLDGFDLPAFTSAGGDWELLKSILKNAATTTNTSSFSSSTNPNKSEANTNKNKINSTINTNKSEQRKKPSSYYANTAPSTLSGSSDEDKATTKQGKPLYTVTISDKDGKITFSDENGTKTYKHPMNNSTEGEKESGFIGHCKVMSNSNVLKPEPDSNTTSFEVSSNMGIRAFLYGMRERLPNTVKLINNIMGNEESYYDFIYKELSDEFLNDLIEGLDKEMEKYNSLVTYFKDQK